MAFGWIAPTFIKTIFKNVNIAWYWQGEIWRGRPAFQIT